MLLGYRKQIRLLSRHLRSEAKLTEPLCLCRPSPGREVLWSLPCSHRRDGQVRSSRLLFPLAIRRDLFAVLTFFPFSLLPTSVPASLTWSSNSIIGSTKRSVSSALIIAFGGIGGILGTSFFRSCLFLDPWAPHANPLSFSLFPSYNCLHAEGTSLSLRPAIRLRAYPTPLSLQEYPRYLTGIWVTIGAQFMSIIISLVLMASMYRANKLVQQGFKVRFMSFCLSPPSS
jgi:hypothetical protein